MEPELFGTLLKRVRMAKGLKVPALADTIGVDKSLVYRWEANKRIPKPAPHPDDVDRLVEALSLDDHIAKKLREAQMHSLRALRPHASATALRRTHSTTGKHLLDAVRPVRVLTSGMRETRSRPMLPPSISGARSRRARLVQEATRLIARAAEQEPRDDQPIQISMQARILFDDLPSEVEALGAQWRLALRRALDRGWEVKQLWRLDRNLERTLHLVTMMLDLVGHPRYHPYLFERYGVLRPPQDLIIVPGVGVMILLAGSSLDFVDDYLLVTDARSIAAFSAYFGQLAKLARPSLRGFETPNQEFEFTQALVASEERSGGRRLVKHGLSAITYPPAFFEDRSIWSRRMFETNLVHPEHQSEYLALLRRRQQAFLSYVGDHDYRDICPRRALDELAAWGNFPPDAPNSPHAWPDELRLQQLEHTRTLLQEHSRFQLALISDEEMSRMFPEPTLIVNGEETAFIRAWLDGAENTPTVMDLEVAEPSLVEALAQYFDDQWECIPVRYQDKRFVIGYIDSLITGVRERLGELGDH